VVHPYSAVPGIGTVVQARATAVTTSAVQLDDGQELSYDYLILAPGSSYPEPIIKGFSGSLADRKASIKVSMSSISQKANMPLLCLCTAFQSSCQVRAAGSTVDGVWTVQAADSNP
jgi:anthranilate/para-aminobenzoate synthase component II